MGAPSDSQQVTEERSKNVVDFAAREYGNGCEKRATVGVAFEEEKAGRAAGCRREAAAPAPAGLPCRSSNNSDRKRYRLWPYSGGKGLVTDREGRTIWEKDEDDETLYRWRC